MNKKLIFKICITIAGFFFFISLALVGLGRFLPILQTPLMFIRTIQQLTTSNAAAKIPSATSKLQSSASKTSSAKPATYTLVRNQWVPQEAISKHMRTAVIASEDARFFEHNGFDWEAIEKAMKYNETHQQKKGASTISQQTAKNLFLWPARSWFRKGLEFYFTFLIELMWSKERILEVYLNITEFSPTVFGVESAARHFFHKSAKDLTAAEAALLTAVLPNPKKWNVSAPSGYVLNRQQRILARMQRISDPTFATQNSKPANATALKTNANSSPVNNSDSTDVNSDNELENIAAEDSEADATENINTETDTN